MNLSYLRIVAIGTAILLAALVGGCTKSPSGETAGSGKELAAAQGSELLRRIEALHPNDRPHEILKELSIDQAKELAEEVYKLRLEHPAPLTFSEFMLLGLTSHRIQFVSITPDGRLADDSDFKRYLDWDVCPPEERESRSLPEKATDLYVRYSFLADNFPDGDLTAAFDYIELYPERAKATKERLDETLKSVFERPIPANQNIDSKEVHSSD